ncbi:MAG: chemotaxis-specific protein-glutamate methyltransferase CheB [bacterium]
MIRVLVADDSHAARLLIVSLLESDPEIEVVGQVADGESAVVSAKRLRPDVITMDIYMPRLDGLEATARIMSESPTPIVVVSSTVSAQDVASSLAATKAGALVAVPKPGAAGDRQAEEDRRAFVATVKAMARVKVVRRWSGAMPAIPMAAQGGPPQRQDTASDSSSRHHSSATATGSLPSASDITRPAGRVALVVIAASTGGPTALQTVLSALPASFPAPIVVVQHIARGFLAGFAGWLDGECAVRVRVAAPPESLEPGTVYIAPDEDHLGISANRRTRAIDGPMVNGFKPSGSVLFESAADAFGRSLVAVILTGMGSDGVSGLYRVRATGGYVIAQDEASSLIYGMPGEAVMAGVVDVSLPIDRIAAHLQKIASASPSSRLSENSGA